MLAATATWWRILLDPDSRALDRQFSTEVEQAIRSTEAWAAREPQNAEAHFYAGAAYAARVQWRVLRDEKLAAARDGKRIKQALERAIALDPDLDDAYFGIGLYQYYADVAPAAAKMLRFLLMLPGGRQDRRHGADEAGARATASCSRARPTTSCRSSTSGTSGAPTSRSSCSSRCAIAIPAIRCSRPSSPTCRTATSTTSPRASRRGARCWPPRATIA